MERRRGGAGRGGRVKGALSELASRKVRMRLALAAREKRGKVAKIQRGGWGEEGGLCIRHGPTGGREWRWGRRRLLLIEQLSQALISCGC